VSDRPLLRSMIDAIHELQRRTATVHERAAANTPTFPDCISRTPRAGTAVSPYHAVFAAHYPLQAGSLLWFGSEKRQVTQVQMIGGDIGVATWKHAILATPMRVLPWDWQRHLPTKRNQEELRQPITTWRTNQHGELFRGTTSRFAAGGIDVMGEGQIVPGDSGCPVFLALDTPVILGCLSVGGGASCLSAYWQALLEATNWMVREAEF
jgi:hypothetical protein